MVSLISSAILPREILAAATDNYTWIERNNGLSGAGGVYKIAIDPNNANTLYALLNAYGVYKSTDGGSNWSASNTGLPSGLAHNITTDPSNSDTLYVIIDYTIYKSINAGVNWSQSHSGIRSWGINNGIRFITVDPNDSDILYAGTIVSNDDGGVWKSTDAGANWTQVAGNDLGSGCDNDIAPLCH